VARRSPEEKAALREAKAAQRREEWNRRVAAGEAEAARQRAAAAQKQADYEAGIRARAERLSSQGKPIRFLYIDIAVMDGKVYVRKPGFSERPVLLGPLAGARATVKRLRPKVESRFVSAVIFGGPDTKKLGRVEVIVSTSQGTHRKLVEAGNEDSKRDERAEKDVRDFNALARTSK
jgi:hypothetical protein